MDKCQNEVCPIVIVDDIFCIYFYFPKFTQRFLISKYIK